MKLSEIIKKDVSAEVFNTVVDALGEDKDYDLVPRTRMNEVIQTRDELKTQVKDLKEKADKLDTMSADYEKLKKESDDSIKALNDKLAGTTKEFSIKEKLITAKAKNVTAVKALLDPTKLGDDLAGLDAEIARLQKDEAYLFGEGTAPGAGTGAEGAGGAGAGAGDIDEKAYEAKMRATMGLPPLAQ
jgi:uncharacterized membrane-anchored protein YhcB (DUF1043 family)